MTTRRFLLLLCAAAATALPACDPTGPSEAGPALDSIRPRAALVGNGEISLGLWGEEFTESSVARWGDMELSTTYLGAGELRAIVPATLLGTADSVPVTVAGSSARDTAWFMVVGPLPPAGHRTLAAGNGTTCGIAADGATICWGVGAAQLAPNPPAGPLAMRRVEEDPGFVHLTAGGNHACGLTAEGVAYCWGGSSPALGNPDPWSSDSPTPVATDLRFADLDSGTGVTCGVTTVGEAYCWGSDERDLLGSGTGSTGTSVTPLRVQLDTPVVAISVGQWSACAVGVNARLYCWGAPRVLGREDGTPGSGSNLPGPVSGDELYVDVAVANAHTCALTVHRAVYCWTSGPPRRVGDGPFITVLDGDRVHFCASAPDGTGWCWGDPGPATLGTVNPGWTPSPVVEPTRFGALATGTTHFCGIGEDDLAYCWGWIGNGTGLTWHVPAPAAVATDARFTSLDAGSRTTCGVATDERILCWGDVVYVRGGDPILDTFPVGAAAGMRFRAVSVESGACGIRTTGMLSCWGVVSGGSFDLPGDWLAVDEGGAHGCAIDGDGAAYCWGLNEHGQLGDGSTVRREAPVAVAGGHRFRQISVGEEHTCAVTVDDDAFCWGYNRGGAVGDGTTLDRLEPAAVSAGQGYVAIRATARYSCARTVSGDVDCWGEPIPSDFDRAPETCRSREGWYEVSCYTTPARLRSTVAMDRLATGELAACGLDSGGQVLCWGRSLNMDVRDIPPVRSPEPVGDAATYQDIVVGFQHVCGLQDDGAAFCWGYNDQRVLLGVPGAPDPSIPTLVSDSVRF